MAAGQESKEFRRLQMTPAILKLLDSEPAKEWKTIEIGAVLKDKGVKTKATKNFQITVTSTLLRLSKLGRIVRTDAGYQSVRGKKTDGGQSELTR